MRRRAGLRARPRGLPYWAWLLRHVLTGLRRKHPIEYRAMRKRLSDALPQVSDAMVRVRAGALAAITGRTFYTNTDADRLCAVVLESVAWWAVEERRQVQPIREAARELLALHERIDAAVDELSEAIERSRELCGRFGLRVNHPMWRDDLGEAIAEARRRFVRWGYEPEVKALDEFESRSLYSPRPGVIDLVLIARNLGAAYTVGAKPLRNDRTGEWLRSSETWVSGDDGLTEQALANKPGSGPESERAQLRQLMAGLRTIALNQGWDDGEPGPLEFLTDRDLSVLCAVAVGPPSDPSADPFNAETVRKARASFTKR